MITTSLKGEAPGAYRLVQAVTRRQLDPEQQRQWTAAALSLMWAAVPQHPDDTDAWPVMARLLPHVLAVSEHATSGEVESDTTAGLLTETARYLWSRAELQQATRLLERALTLRETRLGPDHPRHRPKTSTTSPPSSAPRATSTTPAPCSSAP